MTKMFLFDSVKKEKVPFLPQEENKVKMYVCGPTVYDDAHLGHARSSIVFDLLHRVLKANGYEVTFVKNFTDIDDKIIKKMEQTGSSLEEITSFYIKSYKDEMDKLNILPSTIEPKATENLDSMRELVDKLLLNGKAYKLDDGIYLKTSSDSNYGDISHRVSDEASIGRIEVNSQKEDKKDFALWKFNTNTISYEASFGCGRPGWHCECSAMIDKHLSDKSLPFAIDIHGGGADLLFPHHENEASQTRMAYGQELSKYWIHNGFVNIDGEKMSKSLGNSFFLKDALKEYSGEVIRFYMLTTHYRSDLSFNTEDLEASKKRLDKLYRLKKKANFEAKNEIPIKKPNQQLKSEIMDALNDDLNTSKAFVIIDEYITGSYNLLANSKTSDKSTWAHDILADIKLFEDILGIGYQNSEKYFQFGVSEDEKKKIAKLILERAEAKKEKNFSLSDAIRDELSSMKISITDTPSGTLWEKL